MSEIFQPVSSKKLRKLESSERYKQKRVAADISYREKNLSLELEGIKENGKKRLIVLFAISLLLVTISKLLGNFAELKDGTFHELLKIHAIGFTLIFIANFLVVIFRLFKANGSFNSQILGKNI